jgi:hypothetical protein
VYPEDVKFLQAAYKDATARPFGYLLLDLTQTQKEEYRFRTNIFSFEIPQNLIYVSKKININEL